jgi:hypothetical protein
MNLRSFLKSIPFLGLALTAPASSETLKARPGWRKIADLPPGKWNFITGCSAPPSETIIMVFDEDHPERHFRVADISDGPFSYFSYYRGFPEPE